MITDSQAAAIRAGFEAGINDARNGGFGEPAEFVEARWLGVMPKTAAQRVEVVARCVATGAVRGFEQRLDSMTDGHLRTAGRLSGIAAAEWARLELHRQIKAERLAAGPVQDTAYQIAHRIVRDWQVRERFMLGQAHERSLVSDIAVAMRNRVTPVEADVEPAPAPESEAADDRPKARGGRKGGA
ncbi:MAG TPA: hypothetical protein VNK52_16135 [Hyphomicrobiaceae bacterium]|nr:hypothetical protein [Hyphomicrobiaceae bacterium]